MVTVEKIMNRHVITIDSGASVLEAAQLMADNHIGCVVATKNGSPAGILTERDVLVLVASETNVKKTKIESVMTHYLITTGPHRSIEKAIEIMVFNKIKKLPVVDEKGRLVGIITASDIISAKPHAAKKMKHMLSLNFFRKK